jgi:hypothetical protein
MICKMKLRLTGFDVTEVTTTLTDMIIRTISDRANLLDSFVILYASFVAALYKLKGADLGERNYLSRAAFKRTDWILHYRWSLSADGCEPLSYDACSGRGPCTTIGR